ncbi:MAG: FCD domain-containing protein [Acidimicrobiales bacterium]
MSRTPTGDERRPQPAKKSLLLAQDIVRNLVDDGTAPGARLPPESEMIERYGVARSTTREALRLLETQGVISIRTGPNGGPVVSELDARPMAGNIALLLEIVGSTFRSVIDARMVVEPPIAARAAEVADAQLCERLERNVAAMAATSDALLATTELSAEFHDLVAASSTNPLLAFLLKALHHVTVPYVAQVTFAPSDLADLVRSHTLLADAIVRGDADAAGRAMRADIVLFCCLVDRTRPELWDAPIHWSDVNEGRAL